MPWRSRVEGDDRRVGGALIDDRRVRRGLDAIAAVLFFYFVQQWLWPAPMGVLVQGILIGGLTALVAFGIALLYRGNRVINFAQGDLGGAPASLAVLLIVAWHWRTASRSSPDSPPRWRSAASSSSSSSAASSSPPAASSRS